MSFACEEDAVRKQVAEAIAESRPDGGIGLDIVTHWNATMDREELWVTAFMPFGISVGFCCVNIDAAQRVLAQARRDPRAWVARRVCGFNEEGSK